MGRTTRLLRRRRARTRPPRARSLRGECALGALATQFAHDVKNPLAALKGAAQYLREEQCRRGAPAEESDFVALMLREVERLRQVVEAHEAALRATAAEGTRT